jgi:hypothetical protein
MIAIRRLILRRRPRIIAFPDVYALQLCTRFTRGGGDSSDSLTHELNLVLSQPAGARVALMVDDTVRPLREQAEQLGKVMGKPVLDHSNQDWPKMPETWVSAWTIVVGLIAATVVTGFLRFMSVL